MEKVLEDINAVVGVTGSFVCDSEGRPLAQVLPSVFDQATLTAVGRTARQTIAGLETTRKSKVTDLDLVYDQGRLVIKNFPQGCLIILCVRNINVPLLNLTANVATRKLSERLKALPQGRVAERVAPPPKERPKVEAAMVEEVEPATLEDEARRAVSAAQGKGVVLRVMGTVGVLLHSPRARHITLPFAFRELNFAGYGKHRRQIGEVFEALGYESHRRFNALQGHKHLRFSHPGKEIEVHVFVDLFEMYHKLDFANRLHLDDLTIPLADLLLSKLQVVEMNEEELREIYALVYEHEWGDKADPEKIDAESLVRVCSDDWGWYKTVTTNIAKAISLAEELLVAEEKEVIAARLRRLNQMIEGAPKSLRWQLRARVGESSRWYNVPEEA